jgi:cytochrome c-type biogenesis protein CcmE
LLVLAVLAGVGIATALLLRAFQENMLYYVTPERVKAGAAPAGRPFRMGGLVVTGSVQRAGDGLTSRFTLTDLKAEIPVSYRGILPDLFREGQGIVALGTYGADGVFVASEVLAKHDEKYMPPEVAESLKKNTPPALVAPKAGPPPK